MMKKATNKWGITDPDTVADSQSQPKKISKTILRTGHVDMTPENADVGMLVAINTKILRQHLWVSSPWTSQIL